ncbi:hypothetical protein QUB05_10460 [Microcoleus sp. F10-C6]
MEIARCKRLFHPTSRSDRSFDELQKRAIANSFQIAIALLNY